MSKPVKINLGTITIDRETWDLARYFGYTREMIKNALIAGGEGELALILDGHKQMDGDYCKICNDRGCTHCE